MTGNATSGHEQAFHWTILERMERVNCPAPRPTLKKESVGKARTRIEARVGLDGDLRDSVAGTQSTSSFHMYGTRIVPMDETWRET